MTQHDKTHKNVPEIKNELYIGRPNIIINPFIRVGFIKFFSDPQTGLFSVKIWKKIQLVVTPLKISLSMIRCPDNQINASFN